VSLAAGGAADPAGDAADPAGDAADPAGDAADPAGDAELAGGDVVVPLVPQAPKSATARTATRTSAMIFDFFIFLPSKNNY